MKQEVRRGFYDPTESSADHMSTIFLFFKDIIAFGRKQGDRERRDETKSALNRALTV